MIPSPEPFLYGGGVINQTNAIASGFWDKGMM
jgi:hypothetical protein